MCCSAGRSIGKPSVSDTGIYASQHLAHGYSNGGTVELMRVDDKTDKRMKIWGDAAVLDGGGSACRVGERGWRFADCRCRSRYVLAVDEGIHLMFRRFIIRLRNLSDGVVGDTITF